MYIKTFELGPFQTNCYILTSAASSDKCIIVDPGFDPEPLVEFLVEYHWTPEKIILTHGHSDHIAGISLLKRQFPNTPVYIGRNDADKLCDATKNLSTMLGMNVVLPAADKLLDEGDKIELFDETLEVLDTPGHTKGGICFLNRKDNLVITGDTLFANSIGRTDFPDGDMRQIKESIQNKLLVLPDDTSIHPGHGVASTIGQEKAVNPYLNGEF